MPDESKDAPKPDGQDKPPPEDLGPINVHVQDAAEPGTRRGEPLTEGSERSSGNGEPED